jgi:tetratricopeptide (TPR) repeat protein
MSRIHRGHLSLIPVTRKAALPKNQDLLLLAAAEELQRAGQFRAAFTGYFDLMVRYGPNTNIGNRAGFLAALALFQMREYRPAIQLMRDDVIGDDPTHVKWSNPDHHYNLGVLYQAAAMPREAAESYRTALSLKPDMATAENNLGNALRELGDVETAETCFDRLLARDPQDPEARYNLSYITLLRGMLARGFELYEDRLRCAGYVAEYHRAEITTPRMARDQASARVFVHQEQGVGDTLQYLRFLPLLAAQGHDVTFESPIELGDWLEALDVPGVRVIRRGTPIPPHDVHLPMMSLPYFVGITSERDIPAPLLPPIRVPSPLWTAAGDERPVIGLCWAGNAKHRNDHYRSMPVDALAPILRLPHTRFVSLQVGSRGIDLLGALPRLELGAGSELVTCSSGMASFEATAALVRQCAAVVSVDTSILHLAGGLGVRALALTSWLSEWRWQLDRTDSPWYPSVELVRQPTLGDWNATAERARHLLEAA